MLAQISFLAICSLLLLPHVADAVKYDRYEEKFVNLKKKKIRYLLPCGNKATIRKPYVKLPVKREFSFPQKGAHNYYDYFYDLAKCDIDFLCFEEFVRASEKGNDELVLHYLQNGTSFWLPAHDKNPNQWFVAQLFEIFQKYNVTAKAYDFVHAVDESAGYNHPDLFEFYQLWRKSYRFYWWDTPNFKKLHEAGQLDWLPSRFLTTPDIPFSEMSRSSVRSHGLTFIGNTNTNRRRQAHVNEIETKVNLTVHGIVKSTGGAFSVNFAGGTVYLDTMLDSRFCLQLKGKSSECHRLYESMECGCIPVVIDEYDSGSYGEVHRLQLTVLNSVEWRKGHEIPFIWVKTVQEFKAIYDDYTGSPDGLRRLDVLQSDVMEWWGKMKDFVQNYYANEFCKF